jgi:UDP-3-O-[3-hydroxymyristoyl] glucosamine N-acyltransferase
MGSTIVRKGVKIDNLVQIAHNCDIGENTVMAAQTGISGSVKVGKNCQFGGQTGVAGHLSIGNNVTIGAQAGVIKSIKDNETVWGLPAINIKDQMRALSIFKDLPKLRSEVIQLQNEINKLKTPED